MTFPAIVNTNTTTATVSTSPTAINLPASLVSGNLLFVFIAVRAVPGTITQPSGWSTLFSFTTGNNTIYSGFYKTSDGTEGSTVSITHTTGVVAAVSYQISGWSGTPEVTSAVSGAGVLTVDPATLTPSWGSLDTLWLAVACGSSSTTARTLSSGPSTFGTPVTATENTVTSVISSAASLQATASSENPGVFTFSNSMGDVIAYTIGVKPVTNVAYTLAVAAGAYTLSGVAALFPVARKVTAVAGSYTLTGVAAILKQARKMAMVAGAYALSGVAVLLHVGKVITVVAGSYTLTGVAVLFHVTLHMVAVAGSYTLTGVAATLTRGNKIIVAAGSYVLSGVATLFHVALHLPAVAGSYTLTGVAANLNKGKIITAVAGAYTLTGVAALFKVALSIKAVTGSYILSGVATILSWVLRLPSAFLKSRKAAPALQLLRSVTPSLALRRSVTSSLTKLRSSDPQLRD